MKKQIAYQLIEASNPSDLEEFVNTAIGNGWACQGGVNTQIKEWQHDHEDYSFTTEAVFLQAMVKYED